MGLGQYGRRIFFTIASGIFKAIVGEGNRHFLLAADFVVKTLHKKWSFPLRISSENVTKSAGNCGFGYIY